MVIYFTGTGNSRYLAQKTAGNLSDEIVSANEMIKERRKGDFRSEKPYVFICPTYAWQIPEVFEKFINQSGFSGNSACYFILNCGSGIGNAQKGIEALCRRKGFRLMGVKAVKMPENYIALFSAPDEETAEKIIRIAGRELEGTIRKIQRNESLERNRITLAGRLESGPVHKIFCRFIISDRKFRVKDSCTSCGKCVSLCPLNNIQLDDNGRPVWNGNCTHCMACICGCPSESIEYGKRTEGKRRYFLK